MKIEGAVALVTGGARGLGLAIASYLSERGAMVVVLDLDIEAMKDLPDGIERHEVDVTHPDDVKTVVGKIIDKHKRIDILVNNAGVIFSEPFVNIMKPETMMHNYERFKNSLVVNLDSVFIVTSAVVHQMVLHRTQGSIVNISSISANGNEGQTAYSAAKAGVEAMSVTWAKELGRFGIRCNAVAPGFVDTESTSKAITDTTVKHIVDNTPLRRLGKANEVAQAVGAVIENDFMSGAVLDINGGLTI